MRLWLAGAALSLGSAAGARPSVAPTIDVLHYDVRLSLGESRIEDGLVRITVRRAGPATTLVLDQTGLSIGDVTVGGAPSRFRRDSTTVRIELPKQTRAVDTLSVAVRFSGSPGDGLRIMRDSSNRWSAMADNWPNRAHYWFPCVDRPDDKATVAWQVAAPRAMTVIANGAPVELTLQPRSTTTGEPGDTSQPRVTSWREAHPIPTYLMVVAAAPFERRELVRCTTGDSTCVSQELYVAPGVAPPKAFQRAPEMVAYFASLVAPFPYEKLWHVQSSTQFGGMENASAIFYPDGAVRAGTLREDVIAHETAHQWFGDAVTERTFSDLWLSEGFATYFAALWAGHAHGDSALRATMDTARAEVLASPPSLTRPVRDTAQTDYMQLLNTNSYQKGAWVLHMLRGEVGDSAFFRGIRAYYAAHRDGNATSADLRAAMERAAGRDLGWFFTQWLTRPGAAAFTLTRLGDAPGGNARYELRQTSALPYRFDLTVAERGSGRRATVRVTDRVATLTLPAGPLDLDPDVKLLFATGPR